MSGRQGDLARSKDGARTRTTQPQAQDPGKPKGKGRRAAARKPPAFDALVSGAARRHALPTSLLHAVISAESRYAPQAANLRSTVQRLLQESLEVGRDMGDLQLAAVVVSRPR